MSTTALGESANELLGWAGSEALAEGTLETSINQVMLRKPPMEDLAGPPADVHATVRHGAVPAETDVPGIPPLQVPNPAYLLDLDVYVAGQQPFDPARILMQFEMFHEQIDRFFYWSLTKEGAEHFGIVK